MARAPISPRLPGLPVILVLDISGQSQTAAAVARGFAGFRPDVEIAGVILNRAGSERHVRLARAGFDEIGMRVFGAIHRNEAIRLPERHLGLVQAGEIGGLSACLDALADLAEAHIDIEGLLKTPSPLPSPQARHGELASLRFRIRWRMRMGEGVGCGVSIEAGGQFRRPLSPLGERQSEGGLAPARPAHRARSGRGVFVRLSASSEKLEGGGGGDFAFLAAGR